MKTQEHKALADKFEETITRMINLLKIKGVSDGYIMSCLQAQIEKLR